MAIREITTLGNPILRTVAQAVAPIDANRPAFRKLIADMIETMHHANGIGIAAPQVGVSQQIAIINAKDGPFAIINPKITRRSIRTETEEEGCLSIPGVFGTVKRSRSVTVEYLDANARLQTVTATGLLARVFQHEIDHLNGVLFIDRMLRLTQGKLP